MAAYNRKIADSLSNETETIGLPVKQSPTKQQIAPKPHLMSEWAAVPVDPIRCSSLSLNKSQRDVPIIRNPDPMGRS